MGRFVSTSDTRTVKAGWWEPWEEVTIRRWSIEQRDKLNAQIVRITGRGGDDPTEMELMAAQVPVLEAGIASWTFTEDGTQDGKRVLPSKQNISRLAPRDADYIVTEIWEFNKPPSEDEQNTFPAEGAASGEGQE